MNNILTSYKNDNKTITTVDWYGRQNIYEIVEKIPSGFTIWNIGENIGTNEYIPLCEIVPNADGSKSYNVNINTLKAVKVTPDEWRALVNAAHWGIGNLKTAEKYLKSKRNGIAARRYKALAEKTIEIFRRIS